MPDLDILNTDFFSPVNDAVNGIQAQVTTLTNGLGVLDCLAGLYGDAAPGELSRLLLAWLTLLFWARCGQGPRRFQR